MSTKKKRKRQRTSEPSAPPRFSIGDQVRTRHGTADPVPIEQPEQIVTRPLSTASREERIRAIFELTSDDPLPEVNGANLRQYHAYLAAALSLPFHAYWEETLPFSTQKYRVTVVGLVDADEYDPDEAYGLLCEIRRDEADSRQTSVVIEGRRQNHAGVLQFLRKLLGLSAPPVEPCEEGHCLPLAEIEIRRSGRNRWLIGDYAFWFWDYG